jgi:hypothetical protein
VAAVGKGEAGHARPCRRGELGVHAAGIELVGAGVAVSSLWTRGSVVAFGFLAMAPTVGRMGTSPSAAHPGTREVGQAVADDRWAA